VRLENRVFVSFEEGAWNSQWCEAQNLWYLFFRWWTFAI